MMLFHTTFVVTTLLGHPVTWNAQDRGDRGITFLEALSRHKWHVLIGLAWGGGHSGDSAALTSGGCPPFSSDCCCRFR